MVCPALYIEFATGDTIVATGGDVPMTIGIPMLVSARFGDPLSVTVSRAVTVRGEPVY